MTDIALIKSQIEKQVDDYAQAIADYAAFMADYRARSDPAQRRVARFRKAAAEAAQ